MAQDDARRRRREPAAAPASRVRHNRSIIMLSFYYTVQHGKASCGRTVYGAGRFRCWRRMPGRVIPDSVSLEANIPYDQYKETVLDILQPKAASKEKRPGVIVIHGGGWVGGTKERLRRARVPALRRERFRVRQRGVPAGQGRHRAGRRHRRAERRALVREERQEVQRGHEAHRGDGRFGGRTSFADGGDDAEIGQARPAGQGRGRGEFLRHHRRRRPVGRPAHAGLRRHLGAGASRPPRAGRRAFRP